MKSQYCLFTIVVQSNKFGSFDVFQHNWDGAIFMLRTMQSWDDLVRQGYVHPDSIEWLM